MSRRSRPDVHIHALYYIQDQLSNLMSHYNVNIDNDLWIYTHSYNHCSICTDVWTALAHAMPHIHIYSYGVRIMHSSTLTASYVKRVVMETNNTMAANIRSSI